jgi:competence protein ComEC
MTHRKETYVHVVIGGFGAGVLVHSVLELGAYFSVFLSLLALTAACLYVSRRAPLFLFTGIFLVSAVLGGIRTDMAFSDTGDARLDARLGMSATLIGTVIDEPDERETNTKLTVEIEQAFFGADIFSVSERVLITTERYPRYAYGDMVRIRGELERPEAFVGDDGRLFHYDRYLGKDDIFYTLYFPEAKKIGEGGGFAVKRLLFSLKHAFLERVAQVIHEPESSLLGGLVVGAKRSMGEVLLEDFRRTGIIHIVVLSGYNVTIVAEFIMRMLSVAPALLSWSAGIAAIVLFAVMTGASATIVRASIMAILVVIARATGRTYAITHALFIAGFLMVLHNPKILLFDASFQLSFLATLGLVQLAPRIERYFKWLPTTWQLREFATATLATQLFVLPLILYLMGEFSVVALPVNLLILPVVPITMLLGALTGALGFIHVALSLPFAYASSALLSYQLFVVELFSRLPFASLAIESFSLFVMCAAYALYGLVLFKLYKNSSASAEPRERG